MIDKPSSQFWKWHMNVLAIVRSSSFYMHCIGGNPFLYWSHQWRIPQWFFSLWLTDIFDLHFVWISLLCVSGSRRRSPPSSTVWTTGPRLWCWWATWAVLTGTPCLTSTPWSLWLLSSKPCWASESDCLTAVFLLPQFQKEGKKETRKERMTKTQSGDISCLCCVLSKLQFWVKLSANQSLTMLRFRVHVHLFKWQQNIQLARLPFWLIGLYRQICLYHFLFGNLRAHQIEHFVVKLLGDFRQFPAIVNHLDF